jgi:hypothetical protein
VAEARRAVLGSVSFVFRICISIALHGKALAVG